MNEELMNRVDSLLHAGAIEKSYNNALREVCKYLPHALGEIIYKVVRYDSRHKIEDLEKIVAWATLLWEEHHGERELDQLGSLGEDPAGGGARPEPPRGFDAGSVQVQHDPYRGDRRSGEGGAADPAPLPDLAGYTAELAGRPAPGARPGRSDRRTLARKSGKTGKTGRKRSD